MTTLGNFLGALLKEITRARLHADLEALRVSELYRSKAILEDFSIPRFKLPEITIDIPLMISDVQQLKKDLISEPIIPLGLAVLNRCLDMAIEDSGYKISIQNRSQIRKNIKNYVDNKWQKPTNLTATLRKIKNIVEISSKHFSDLLKLNRRNISRTGTKALKDLESKDDNRDKQDDKLQNEKYLSIFKNSHSVYLHHQIFKSVGEQLYFIVQPKTSAIRDIDPSMLTQLSLTIKEDSLESVEIKKDDGTFYEKLVPE